MPFAAVITDGVRYELKSLEGAYVIIKRMTYGQKLERSSLTRVSLDMSGKKDVKGELALATREATYRDFANCILSHNLEKDAEGTPFNLSSRTDVDFLDPRVGDEISKLIDELNNFEDGEDAKN